MAFTNEMDFTKGKTILINFLLVILSFQFAQCTPSCGQSLEKHLQNRIISGYDIGYYKYPWYGLIKENGNLKCSCTMINEKYALTVASCFKKHLPVKQNHNITGVYTVTLGAYNRCNLNESTQQTFTIQTIYIHAGYDTNKRANNIALIKLSTATTFEPICLPTKPIPESQRPSEGIITGAGLTIYNTKNATCFVHEARILIYPNDYCNKSLVNIGEDTSLIDKNFCAGGAKETKPYGCGSDIGGPLIAEDNTTTKYLLGLISYKKCPDNDNIAIYVDVSKYLDWIHLTINLSKPVTPTISPTPSPTSPPAITPTQSDTISTEEDYEYLDFVNTTSTTSTTSTTTTTTTTPSSVIIGDASKKHHNAHGHHMKHGGHVKREAKGEHQEKHNTKHHEEHAQKHHEEHAQKLHKKHHHVEEHELHKKKH